MTILGFACVTPNLLQPHPSFVTSFYNKITRVANFVFKITNDIRYEFHLIAENYTLHTFNLHLIITYKLPHQIKIN